MSKNLENKANLNANLDADQKLNDFKDLDKNAVHKDFSAAKDKLEGHFKECDNHLKDKEEVHFKDQETFMEKAKDFAGDVKDKIVHGACDAYSATKDFIVGDKNAEKKL